MTRCDFTGRGMAGQVKSDVGRAGSRPFILVRPGFDLPGGCYVRRLKGGFQKSLPGGAQARDLLTIG